MVSISHLGQRCILMRGKYSPPRASNSRQSKTVHHWLKFPSRLLPFFSFTYRISTPETNLISSPLPTSSEIDEISLILDTAEGENGWFHAVAHTDDSFCSLSARFKPHPKPPTKLLSSIRQICLPQQHTYPSTRPSLLLHYHKYINYHLWSPRYFQEGCG